MEIADKFAHACEQERKWQRVKEECRQQLLSGAASLIGDHHIVKITPRVTVQRLDKTAAPYPFMSELERETEKKRNGHTQPDWLTL